MVGDDPTNSGYVTFDDPLGDYMEVKDFEAVAFAGGVYKNTEQKRSTDENGKTVDTYTFTDKYTGPVSNAYPDKADLSHILITVTRGSGSAGDTVQVKIPASMTRLQLIRITSLRWRLRIPSPSASSTLLALDKRCAIRSRPAI